MNSSIVKWVKDVNPVNFNKKSNLSYGKYSKKRERKGIIKNAYQYYKAWTDYRNR